MLGRRPRAALDRLNPGLPAEARQDAYRKAVTRSAPSLVLDNRAFHRLLVAGVPVEYAVERRVVGAQARLIDFDDPGANDWLAVNQFTVVEGRANRRPDVVVFVNGLPLAIFELKDASDPEATIWTAFNDHQTKMRDVPGLYACNELLVISDGIEARVGALTSDRERFLPWRTTEGEALAPVTVPQLQVLIAGLFEKRRFLDIVRHFVVFEDDRGKLAKKVAAYHQFHAVNRALAETVRAVAAPGDHRVGVVWHTQGSGKSLTMVFYAGRLVLDPALANPTIVLLTDRNDLDDQLFGTFSRCAELLNQTPVQATDRAHLRALLRVASGGVVFTTIQKFLPDEKGDRHPLLTERRNVVVIADEAHRSQYDFIDGLARHLRDALPNAAFIGFTGTPIEKADANTRAVRQLVSKALAPDGVVDIFAAAGLAKPDISILSDGFLAEVRGLPQRNLAVEMLQRLLNDEIRVRSRRYLVQSRSFGDLLEATLHRYHNRAIEAAQVIEELIQLALELRQARARGEELGLTDDEIAFYDALETNDSAVKVLGDDTLRRIARELVETIRRNTTVDWTVRESVRARLRTLVKRTLRKYGYPPDKQEKATQTVLRQAELLSQDWVSAR